MSTQDKVPIVVEGSTGTLQESSSMQIDFPEVSELKSDENSLKTEPITTNVNKNHNHNTMFDEGPSQKRLKLEDSKESNPLINQHNPSNLPISTHNEVSDAMGNQSIVAESKSAQDASATPKQEIIDLLNSPIPESNDLEVISETRIDNSPSTSFNNISIANHRLDSIVSSGIQSSNVMNDSKVISNNTFNGNNLNGDNVDRNNTLGNSLNGNTHRSISNTIQRPVSGGLETKPKQPLKNRLILLYDKLRYYHLIMQLSELRKRTNENLIILELPQFQRLLSDSYISNLRFDYLNINIEYSSDFQTSLSRISTFIQTNQSIFKNIPEIAYLIHFAPNKKWKTDYTLEEKEEYSKFLETLSKVAGDNVTQCSIINKYDMSTVYITDEKELDILGNEIQEDIKRWNRLKILDFGESSIRSFPGVVKLPESLEILNIGGGYALETLAGFKIPSNLKILLAGQGALHSIDNVTFPPSIERLELCDNKIYYISYVEFPPRLQHLDISQNRIDNLRSVNFPNSMVSLNIAYNPIDSIKTVKFPDNLQYLDVSNIPNESMAGVKFPDLLINLNLQASMTNTRGLRLPPFLSTLNLCDNSVNSINPLKLPNSLSVLYLNNNNIKTLNKVQFPPKLIKLYLGNNMITTLKNVQFPSTLEVLDIEMDPEYDEHEKHLTTLKDVIFPPNLKVLKLGYHSIKVIENFEFPYSLTTLSLQYNELKILRSIRFGNNLKILDLSGNKELINIDHILIPDSVTDLRVPPELVGNLPSYIVDRVNKKQLLLKQSLSF